jgi:formylglycine-generating enzyme required for sulfatase activity
MRMQSSVKRSLWALLVIVIILWLLPLSQAGQQDRNRNPPPKAGFDWAANMGWIAAVLMFGLLVIQYLRRKKDVKVKKLAELEAEEEFKKKPVQKTQTFEERYRRELEAQLGNIGIFGSPDFDSMPVSLDDAFVSLRISETWRSEHRSDPGKMSINREGEQAFGQDLTPAQVMKRAFHQYPQYPLLLVIGDAGSGKTTLLKYYGMCCLNQKHSQLGFTQETLPLFLPLRSLLFRSRGPASLPDNLAGWAGKHDLNIPARQFSEWLKNRPTLVLLDGLDEIGNLQQRRAVCAWINHTCTDFSRARFVVTSRWTGYRKRDCVELKCSHLRADIRDFSPVQQREFLHNWFKAAFTREPKADYMSAQEWRDWQGKTAYSKAEAVIDFLNRKENEGLRQLAGIPMLLQIMAIIWKERQYLPDSRSTLYEVALNYMLDFRDRHKEIGPLMPVEKARQVLEPAALWMQVEVEADEVAKDEMHRFMGRILDAMDSPVKAGDFCANLQERAGLINEYGEDRYIFRHKTFREFLAAVQLLKKAPEPGKIEALAAHLGDDWWEEVLRFFMGGVDADLFDRFMTAFFSSPVSHKLEDRQHTLLLDLVRMAPQKKIDGLVKCLNNRDLNEHQTRYILDCLKATGKEEAILSIQDFDRDRLNQINRSYADDIVAEAGIAPTKPAVVEEATPPSFRNPFEDNVEYILIPGGSFYYKVKKKEVIVPDMCFCKYPVTNKRYRRFMAYLAGEEKELEIYLAKEMFADSLWEFGKTIKDFFEHSGQNLQKWTEAFRSQADDDRHFNEPDQPVVRISWYAARAYCFWLSCLEAAQKGNLWYQHIAKIPSTYRLPTEWEWQWAAAGREQGGSLREYPWSKNKGTPTPELANYGENVGATTPVGRYPEGATPEGLMDMAGNVWEWMENWYDEDKDWSALRGGSWIYDADLLRCSTRSGDRPHVRNDYFGFRVVRYRLSGLP